MYKITPILLFSLLLGCTSIEKRAYQIIVGSKAFTDSIKKSHPECAAGASTELCTDLKKATSAKDTLIDIVEVYCASPTFDNGGSCNPSADKNIQQALSSKVAAAIQIYKQAETDLKGVLK